MKFNNQKNKKSLFDLGFKDGSALCIVNNLNHILNNSSSSKIY